jgi:heptosyltransferase-2
MTKQILIRLPNWVGDVIMALPAIDCLAQNNIKPILIGKPWIDDLLKGLAYEKHIYPKKMLASIQLLKSLKSKDILLFPNSLSSALTAKLAGKKTFGFIQDSRKLLLNEGWRKPSIVHESELFFHLSEQYLKAKQIFAPPVIPVDEQAMQDAVLMLQKHQIASPYVVLCPFAHGLTKDKQSKKWPYWQALIEKLQGVTCIMCPGPQELEEAKNNFSQVHILENVRLNQYAALLKNAQLVIANDSGPMHLAAAVNAPTLALFGKTDPLRVAPANASILGNATTWPSLEAVFTWIVNRL